MKTQLSIAKTMGCIGIYFSAFLAGDLLSSLLFDLLFSVVQLPARGLYSIFRVSGCLLFTVFLFWLCTTKLLHFKMSDFRIHFAIKSWAVLYAVLLPSFVLVCYMLIGNPTVTGLSTAETAVAAVYSAVAALKAGILEEMLFRGYIMKLLEERWNRPVAVLLPSVLFSLLHIPSMREFSVAGVFLLVISGTLVGVMFSLITYKGNSIGGSSLLHTIWNFVFVTDILHITTAQNAYGEPIFSIMIPSDNILLTGAGFGAEASVIAIMGYCLICAAVVFRKKDQSASTGGFDSERE